MHIWTNLQKFLYDKDYFLAYFNSTLYVYNFTKIYLLSSKKIILDVNNRKITISGNNLILKKSCGNELVISGTIKEVSYE
mgnify:FL=1